MKPSKQISVVIPVYNEEKCLYKLHERLTEVLQKLDKSYEIVLVNDGSKDKSREIMNELNKKDPEHLKAIHFNGNFGQHMAVMAGFEHAEGEVVITLDADLQNPPEDIPKLLDAVDKGHDVVEGVRANRQDTVFRRFASRLNNRIRAWMTGISLTDQGSMMRAYKHNVVQLMVMSKERSTFIPALAYNYASNPGEVEVKHDHRAHGESRYNFYRLMRLNFDLMTGFSVVPLQFVTFIGVMVSGVSFLFFIYMILRRLIIGPEVQGVFTLFALMFFLMGLLVFSLGIVGEYIGRIYEEVRRRPRYVIEEILPTVSKKSCEKISS
ncbi:MAG: glycosyltransferase [Gammaproteobacteria bacterium]